MNNRINIPQIQPEAVKPLVDLDKYLKSSSLTARHNLLIKIRVSQINGCAYCINMHTKDARKLGETEQRIYLLNAWRETDLYSAEERCMLALAEEITLIHKAGLTEGTYKEAIKLFDDNTLTQIIMAIININAWTRIGVATKMKPV